MPGERMTAEERLWAAIRLEKPDRVPVVPTLLPEPAAGLTGRTQAEIAADSHAAIDAVFRVFDEHGGWENPYPAAYAPLQLQAAGVFPMKMRVPGRDLPADQPFQLDEQEVLRPDDYAKIAEMGLEQFYTSEYLWRITELTGDDLPAAVAGLVASLERFSAECAKRGTRPFFMGYMLHPFFTLSLMRSMVPFTQDLYYAPQPVERALERMTDDLIARQIPVIKASGVDVWLLAEERASCFFYPPAVSERFWWPYTRRIVEACWSEGIVTVLHLDQCWDRNIADFKRLPRGSAILELDGTTDIFAAKEALRGHLCLHGDVPAALLAIGQPEEVTAYCRRLIDEVGRDGGFILGSGCGVPANVRPENFRALVETGKRYELA